MAASHIPTGALRRRRLRGQTLAASQQVDLTAGLLGLSQLAGNKALIGMVARHRGSLEEIKPFFEEEEPERTLEDDERALARLRGTLHRFEEGLDEKADPAKQYRWLRVWMIELLKSLDDVMSGDPQYDGELEEMLEKVGRLPVQPGDHALEWLGELSDKLRMQGELIHRQMADRLPAHGSKEHTPIDASKALQEFKQAVGKDVEEAVQGARSNRPNPKKVKKDGGSDLAFAFGGAGGAAGILGLTRKKRRKP